MTRAFREIQIHQSTGKQAGDTVTVVLDGKARTARIDRMDPDESKASRWALVTFVGGPDD